MKDARYWIDTLHLAGHPEGGHYRETYRAELTLTQAALPESFQGPRSASTAIYFLLEGVEFSAFHRIPSDEMWHFHAGGTLLVHVIDEQGRYKQIKLGSHPERGESLQAVVPGGCWFGSCLEHSDSFALVGCTVAPGFDFADFELAARSELVSLYPEHRRLIEKLTRSGA